MDSKSEGWLNGFLGVAIFSASLPATRVAVASFSPLFLSSARAVIAACLAAVCLLIFKNMKPNRQDLFPLIIVALGVVLGFPLLTALALQHITSAHSVVFIGLLPLSTSIFGVLRGGERPRLLFWLFSSLGSAAVAGFALTHSQSGEFTGDLLMIAAVVVCGLGYAEGAVLSRKLGGWQVISWALLLASPVMALLGLWNLPVNFSAVTVSAWTGLAYVSTFSMLIGFIFWYRGLALGGIAGVSQLQLLQPFIGLALSGFLLREQVAWEMVVIAGVVVGCVLGARRFA